MIATNLETYNSYKDGDIEWIAKLPSGWGVKRLKEVLDEVVYGISEKTKEVGKYEVLGMGDIEEGKVSFPGKRFIDNVPEELLLREGDLLFNRTNSLALVGKVGLIETELENITFASYLIRLRLKSNQSNRYFWYFLNSENFIAYSRSNAIQTANQANLSSSKLKQFKILLLSLNIQKTIAHYLDTKTAQIDRKIDLLTQKATQYGNLKQSLINETVTRGLDKSVPMKDSGIEAIGKIPEHWNCELIKRSLQVLTDYTANGSFANLAENVTYQETGYARLVRLTDLRHDLTNNGLYVDKNAYEFLSKTKINGGEILIANVGAYTGLVKLVPEINFKATLGPNMFLAIFCSRLLKRFINYHLGSICCFEQFRVQMTATAQPKLNKDNFRSISIVIPPINEQKAIADYLDTKTAQIDQIIQTINTQIEKLKELRKTLINDVVTGKIRVTENQSLMN
jgi:type I restriction enzyme, S subunit